MRRSYTLPLVIVLACAAAALTMDGCSYGLAPADPVSGRSRGCYTAIERWVGVKQPSAIRTAEQVAALASMLVIALVVRRARR